MIQFPLKQVLALMACAWVTHVRNSKPDRMLL